MPLTQDALTQDELDYLMFATLSEKVANPDEVIPLDRIDTPTFNLLMRGKKKSLGDPVRGGFRWNVKGLRGQKLTWWDGMDILPFEERYTGSPMRFYVGKSHFGDTMVFDVLERTGVRIDYNRGIREGAHSKKTLERVVNYIKENREDILYNIRIELAKSAFKTNSDNPKAFTGLLGLMPITNPTGGTIGGQSRANTIFQHLVSTGWTADNMLSNLQAFIKALQRRSNGHRVDIIAVGDNIFDLLVNIFSGSNTGTSGPGNTLAGKFDYRSMRDKAAAYGEKYKVGIPQDAFMYEDRMITCDPIFQELNREDPTTNWPSIGFALTSEYQFMVPVISDVVVPHPMPYNQRVQHTSYHGECTLVNICPNSSGVFTTAYAGLGIGFP
jgi:hypothetical protein